MHHRHRAKHEMMFDNNSIYNPSGIRHSRKRLLVLALLLLVVVLLGEALVAEELRVHALGGDEPLLLLLVETVVPVRLRRGVSHSVVYTQSR